MCFIFKRTSAVCRVWACWKSLNFCSKTNLLSSRNRHDTHSQTRKMRFEVLKILTGTNLFLLDENEAKNVKNTNSQKINFRCLERVFFAKCKIKRLFLKSFFKAWSKWLTCNLGPGFLGGERGGGSSMMQASSYFSCSKFGRIFRFWHFVKG